MSKKDDELDRLSRENDRLCKELERAQSVPHCYPTCPPTPSPYNPWYTTSGDTDADGNPYTFTTTTDTEGLENK